jgi:hypothetical protein
MTRGAALDAEARWEYVGAVLGLEPPHRMETMRQLPAVSGRGQGRRERVDHRPLLPRQDSGIHPQRDRHVAVPEPARDKVRCEALPEQHRRVCVAKCVEVHSRNAKCLHSAAEGARDRRRANRFPWRNLTKRIGVREHQIEVRPGGSERDPQFGQLLLVVLQAAHRLAIDLHGAALARFRVLEVEPLLGGVEGTVRIVVQENGIGGDSSWGSHDLGTYAWTASSR